MKSSILSFSSFEAHCLFVAAKGLIIQPCQKKLVAHSLAQLKGKDEIFSSIHKLTILLSISGRKHYFYAC